MKASTSDMIIFQNYFTPYRHKLFIEIAKKVPLTVVYLQKPEEEGREWNEADFVKDKNYDTLQLENKRLFPIGPFKQVVWVTGLQKLKTYVDKTTKVVLLDNLPTNFTMLRVIRIIGKIVPRKNCILWEEHIAPSGSDNKLKVLYKKFLTVLLSLRVDTVLAFSQMTTEYLANLGIPMAGQKLVRTIQAAYTEKEIAEYRKEADDLRGKRQPITFGFLGYLSKRKGIAEFLNAINYYKNPDAKFLFIGAGPIKEDIEKAAKLDPRIEVKPYAKTETDKTKYFAQMSIHVVPSEKDPWCLVVNEAASRGVLSLVSPNVGAKELVSLVDKTFVLKSNSAISLAKAFTDSEKLLSSARKAAQLQEKTYKIASLWSIEQAAQAFIELA